MKTLARLISALGLASISTFAVWVIAMEFANLRLGIPLPVRLLIMVAAMGIVGIGLGGRTARVQRRLTPVLMGLLSVFPLAAWRAYQFVAYHAGDPALGRLCLRELAVVVFTMVVPCVAGVHRIWSMARKYKLDGKNGSGEPDAAV